MRGGREYARACMVRVWFTCRQKDDLVHKLCFDAFNVCIMCVWMLLT